MAEEPPLLPVAQEYVRGKVAGFLPAPLENAGKAFKPKPLFSLKFKDDAGKLEIIFVPWDGGAAATKEAAANLRDYMASKELSPQMDNSGLVVTVGIKELYTQIANDFAAQAQQLTDPVPKPHEWGARVSGNGKPKPTQLGWGTP